MKIPQCTSCKRQNEQCNITECVAYSHASIEYLRGEVHRLQASLELAQHTVATNNQGSTFDAPPRPTAMTEQQIRREAEELGVLVIGGSRNNNSRSSYGT
jgi:hypothetical protein